MVNHSLTFENVSAGDKKVKLPVIRIPMVGVRSVTVLALVNSGSRYEQSGKHGLAHFFEHIVFKGSKKYPTAQILAATVDGVGANFNAFTSKEYTGYYVKAASEHLDLALDVVSDMLLQPRLLQEDIDREKGVIIEEMNMYADTPSRYVGTLFDRMAFVDSGLSHDIIGNKEAISNFKTQDFRDYLDQWCGLSNIVLVLSGQSELVNDAQVLEKVRSIFSPKGSASKTKKVKVKPYLVQNPFSNNKLHVEFRETQQAHFELGWPGVRRLAKERYALVLLSTVLGGNMSSRLFSEVREKRGLCYYIHSDVEHYHDTGVFGASAGVDPTRVDEALKVTIGEFEAIADGSKPVTDQELERAKDYLLGKMVLSYEDSEVLAQYYGLKQLLLDKIETPMEVMEKLKQVEKKEVEVVAKKLLREKEMRLAVIGPFKDKAKFEQWI